MKTRWTFLDESHSLIHIGEGSYPIVFNSVVQGSLAINNLRFIYIISLCFKLWNVQLFQEKFKGSFFRKRHRCTVDRNSIDISLFILKQTSLPKSIRGGGVITVPPPTSLLHHHLRNTVLAEIWSSPWLVGLSCSI